MKERPLKHRDVNWLYFNERVLLEAADPSTPLLERLKFLAIFSSNLDEYFKVRISQLRQLKDIDKSLRRRLMKKPNRTLRKILKMVEAHQARFGNILAEILSELHDEGIQLLEVSQLLANQHEFLQSYFAEKVRSHCEVLENMTAEDIADGALYLAVETQDYNYFAVSIPVNAVGRFVRVPGQNHQFVYLDDVVRLNLPALLQNQAIKHAFSFKISRDAELYLDDDYNDSELVEKIYNSLGQRKSGQPTRLLHDAQMPNQMLSWIANRLHLGEADIVKGGRYHNISDFLDFPVPEGKEYLVYEHQPALPHPQLSNTTAIFDTIREKDRIIHFPYQNFAAVEDFIATAAHDPDVTFIKMTIYRMAKESKLANALLAALENGKKVSLFVEAQARFDEANNIKWGRIFEEKGAKVSFSVPNIKVHSKIAMIERQEEKSKRRYAYIGTGNFNAKTAKIYCDHGLFTANKKITKDLTQVFEVLERKLIIPKLKRLLVSPFNTRTVFMELIETEIQAALAGRPAKITAKMNSLEDETMIRALYRASESGVEVRLLVRGFSRLVPREKELDANEKPIYTTSIVDRYLEHGRIYLFENNGKPRMYMGSADWMTRNLDKRIEVLTPILDDDVFAELKDILDLQLADNVKARILDKEASNSKVAKADGEQKIRSQYAIYEYLKSKQS